MSNANQAAYPVAGEVEKECSTHGWGSIGLTKREYFAGLAMQAYRMGDADTDPARMAPWAVADADALLAALEQRS